MFTEHADVVSHSEEKICYKKKLLFENVQLFIAIIDFAVL